MQRMTALICSACIKMELVKVRVDDLRWEKNTPIQLYCPLFSIIANNHFQEQCT